MNKIYSLDITKEHCPITFVKTKLMLEKLEKGDILEILLTEGEPLDNVPKTLTEQGHKVLEIKNIDKNIFKIIVEKAGN
jgi:tRNA 2-thiouridine synthesizing protein A